MDRCPPRQLLERQPGIRPRRQRHRRPRVPPQRPRRRPAVAPPAGQAADQQSRGDRAALRPAPAAGALSGRRGRHGAADGPAGHREARTMTSIIALDGATRRYGAVTALADVSLRAAAGETVALRSAETTSEIPALMRL